jgi:hypothetical protein
MSRENSVNKVAVQRLNDQISIRFDSIRFVTCSIPSILPIGFRGLHPKPECEADHLQFSVNNAWRNAYILTPVFVAWYKDTGTHFRCTNLPYTEICKCLHIQKFLNFLLIWWIFNRRTKCAVM